MTFDIPMNACAWIALQKGAEVPMTLCFTEIDFEGATPQLQVMLLVSLAFCASQRSCDRCPCRGDVDLIHDYAQLVSIIEHQRCETYVGDVLL